MNLGFDEAMTLVAELCQAYDNDGVEAMIIPPSLYLRHAHEFIRQHNSKVMLGAQDCSMHSQGAFTGEISADMLKRAGADWTLIGHSERRMYHKEGDDLLSAKVSAALQAGLQVIFCCGEGLDQRDEGLEESVVAQQLTGGLAGLSAEEFKRVVIAYEPVWAIGTGRTAAPEQAQSMHAFIRNWIGDQMGQSSAEHARILYGGSVKPENAAMLFAQPDVDGALVGGASLKASDFTNIIAAGA